MKFLFLTPLIIFIMPSIKALPIEKNIENKFKEDKARLKDLNIPNLQSNKNNLNKSITFFSEMTRSCSDM